MSEVVGRALVELVTDVARWRRELVTGVREGASEAQKAFGKSFSPEMPFMSKAAIAEQISGGITAGLERATSRRTTGIADSMLGVEQMGQQFPEKLAELEREWDAFRARLRAQGIELNVEIPAGSVLQQFEQAQMRAFTTQFVDSWRRSAQLIEPTAKEVGQALRSMFPTQDDIRRSSEEIGRALQTLFPDPAAIEKRKQEVGKALKSMFPSKAEMEQAMKQAAPDVRDAFNLEVMRKEFPEWTQSLLKDWEQFSAGIKQAMPDWEGTMPSEALLEGARKMFQQSFVSEKLKEAEVDLLGLGSSVKDLVPASESAAKAVAETGEAAERAGKGAQNSTQNFKGVGEQFQQMTRLGGSLTAALLRLGFPRAGARAIGFTSILFRMRGQLPQLVGALGQTSQQVDTFSGRMAAASLNLVRSMSQLPVAQRFLGAAAGGVATSLNSVSQSAQESGDGVGKAKQAMTSAVGEMGNFVARSGKSAVSLKGLGAAAKGAGSAIAAKAAAVGLTVPVLGALAAAVAVAVVGIIGLIQTFRSGVQAAKEFQVAYTRLGQVIRVGAREDVAAATRSFRDFNRALSLQTGVASDAIASAQAILLSYENIDEALVKRVTPSLLDISALMGTDMAGSARLLGASLSEPAAAGQVLSIVLRGRLSKDMKEQIALFSEMNMHAAAQDVLLRALAGTQGVAAAQGETLEGAQSRLREHLRMTREELGQQMIPVLTDLRLGMLRASEALKPLTLSILKFNPLVQITKGALELVASSMRAVARAAEVAKPVMDALADSYERFGHVALPPVAKELVQLSKWLSKLREESESTGHIQQFLAGALEDATKAMESQELQAKKLRDTNRQVEDAQDRLIDSWDAIQRAQINLTQSTIEARRAQEDYNRVAEETHHILNGFPESSERAQEAMRNLTAANFGARSSLLSLRGAELSREDAVIRLQDAQENLNKVMRGYGEGSLEARDAAIRLKEAEFAVLENQLKLRDSLLSINQAERSLARSRRLSAAVARVYGDSHRFTEIALERVAESEIDLERKRIGHERAQIDILKGEIDLGKAREHLEQVTNGYGKESRELADAQRDVARAQHAVETSSLGLERAQWDAQEAAREHKNAQEELRYVLHGYPRDSDEARQAVERLEDAQLRARRAPLDLAGAQRELARAERSAERAGEDLNDVLEEQDKLLQAIAKNAALARKELLKYAEDMTEVFLEHGDRRRAPSAKSSGGDGFWDRFFRTYSRGWGIPGFQHGGNIRAGQLSVVGEKGWELFRPSQSGTIINQQQLAAAIISALQGTMKGLRAGPSGPAQPLAVNLVVDGKLITRQLVPHIRALTRERM